MNQVNVNKRALEILNVLVEQYIREGQPVGSKTVAEKSSLPYSPATIRHVMADLEGLGYLRSPHTSAGRVPTNQAYRLFVDRMVGSKKFSDENLEQMLSKELTGRKSTSELVQSASDLLSELSHLAGVVTVPKHNASKLRQVDLLKLSGNRILAILVINEDDVQNRILETDRPYTERELREISQFINKHCAGRGLIDIRKKVLKEMQHDKARMDTLMRQAIGIAEQTFRPESNAGDYVVKGQQNLINIDVFANIDELRNLFDAFSTKQSMLHVLDNVLSADGVQIFIGEEAGLSTLNNFSIVASPYGESGEVVGILGVIGPTRMCYRDVISLVDVTSKLLTTALGEKNE
ncbi:MAG: heat-inducible transcriptional repressor HrcA [Gammaproteobacteria bacterium]